MPASIHGDRADHVRCPKQISSAQVVEDVRQFRARRSMRPSSRAMRVSEAPSYGKPVLLYDLEVRGIAGLSSSRIRNNPARRAPCALRRRGEARNGHGGRWRTFDGSGAALAALIGDMSEDAGAAERAAAVQPPEVRGRCRPPSWRRTRATRGAASSRRIWRISLPPSMSAASSSPSWCGRSPASAMLYEIVAGERRWRAAAAGRHP